MAKSAKTASPLRAVYFSVRNEEYPRNSRIRRYLAELGFEVLVLPAVKEGPAWRNMADNLLRLWKVKGHYDLLVVSEFSLKYAVGTWVISRLRRATHVVDGFVGMYESEIEDRKNASPYTLTAFTYRVIDRIALLAADIYLIDTDVRRDKLLVNARSRTAVLTLPVGAPAWARPSAHRVPNTDLGVLYYGNYIPLHGVEHAVDAIASLPLDSRVRMTLVGDSSRAPHILSKISRTQIPGRFQFIDEVPELELASIIARNDVVLGIFGTSPKASSVIANKVWQGLSAGKVVITRDSLALEEIADLVGSQLIRVDEASAASIRKSIEAVQASDHVDRVGADTVLEDYTSTRYQAFGAVLQKRLGGVLPPERRS